MLLLLRIRLLGRRHRSTWHLLLVLVLLMMLSGWHLLMRRMHLHRRTLLGWQPRLLRRRHLSLRRTSRRVRVRRRDLAGQRRASEGRMGLACAGRMERKRASRQPRGHLGAGATDRCELLAGAQRPRCGGQRHTSLGGCSEDLVVEDVERRADEDPFDHVCVPKRLSLSAACPRRIDRRVSDAPSFPSPSVRHTAFSASVRPVTDNLVPPPSSGLFFMILPNSTRLGGIK